MKLIIAGSRHIIPTTEQIANFIKEFTLAPSIIISGNARGVDRAGEIFANKVNTPLVLFKANWDKLGKSAGYIRNQEMAKYGDALLLIWDGISKGSGHMKKLMEKENKPVYEVIITD